MAKSNDTTPTPSVCSFTNFFEALGDLSPHQHAGPFHLVEGDTDVMEDMHSFLSHRLSAIPDQMAVVSKIVIECMESCDGSLSEDLEPEHVPPERSDLKQVFSLFEDLSELLSACHNYRYVLEASREITESKQLRLAREARTGTS
ncbi:MAG: hypothetical protein QGI68_08555 [Pseudomonadales bacterium]|mgnify:CR=1 FL=1|nr:hypothetical protein [Pseudomonadales bacterium]MDP7357924.1 hypothetical protein [Pseudomonadales bacterium]MDP7595604.1 hypothetical protein [Pseudomonadales bacterium]HJN50354.1 hypothetical protein [Pseudomonadales bacterium]|tara:strand:- start:1801 stop:2235 length:435 start_codon:yes stop_codon:yes gene_type:complete